MERQYELPLCFNNALCVNAAYTLSVSHARKLLPEGVPLNLVEVLPGQAVLAVSIGLYRESPFGVFAEATAALMAIPEPTTPTFTLMKLLSANRYPAYVLHMPVSDAEAQKVGSDLWGLPRTLAEVKTIEEEKKVIGEIYLDGQALLRMEAERPCREGKRGMNIETYSWRNGDLLHGVMRCEANTYGSIKFGGAKLEFGDHPSIRPLAETDVSHQPLMMRFYDELQIQLEAPEKIVFN